MKLANKSQLRRVLRKKFREGNREGILVVWRDGRWNTADTKTALSPGYETYICSIASIIDDITYKMARYKSVNKAITAFFRETDYKAQRFYRHKKPNH